MKYLKYFESNDARKEPTDILSKPPEEYTITEINKLKEIGLKDISSLYKSKRIPGRRIFEMHGGMPLRISKHEDEWFVIKIESRASSQPTLYYVADQFDQLCELLHNLITDRLI